MSVMIKCSKEAFEKCPYHNLCGDAENAFFMDGSDCDKFNQSLNPYTVDAVPVVRCRDCTSFEEIGKYPTNNGGTPFGYCYHWPYEQGMSPNEVDGNDFCSYGERRDING